LGLVARVLTCIPLWLGLVGNRLLARLKCLVVVAVGCVSFLAPVVRVVAVRETGRVLPFQPCLVMVLPVALLPAVF
jgi:hypothetical protein